MFTNWVQGCTQIQNIRSRIPPINEDRNNLYILLVQTIYSFTKVGKDESFYLFIQSKSLGEATGGIIYNWTIFGNKSMCKTILEITISLNLFQIIIFTVTGSLRIDKVAKYVHLLICSSDHPYIKIHKRQG